MKFYNRNFRYFFDVKFYFILFLLGILTCQLIASEDRVVRIGYAHDYPFIDNVGDSDTIVGYGVDLLEQIAEITGWKYEYVVGTWKECLDRLESGEIDILGRCSRTESREKTFEFSIWPIGNEYIMLFTRVDNDTLFYGDKIQLTGLTIALTTGTYQASLFQKFLEDENLAVNIKYYQTDKLVDEAVQKREVDLGVCASLSEAMNRKVIRILGVTPFYFMANKENANLMTQYNEAYETLEHENSNFIAKITEKYLSSFTTDMPIPFTREEVTFIKQSPPLRVLMNSTGYPVEYIDSETGEFSGIYADFWKSIADISGLSFEFVPTSTLHEAEIKLQNNEVDLIARVAPNDIYYDKYGLLFSTPYTYEHLERIVKIDQSGSSHDFSGADHIVKAIIPREDGHLLGYLRDEYDSWDLSLSDSIPNALNDVSKNKSCVALVNSLYLQMLYSMNDYRNLVSYTTQVEQIPLTIGISSKMNPLILSILNKIILSYPNDKIEAAKAEKMINVTYRPSTEARLRFFVPILLFLIILGVIIFFWVQYSQKLLYKKLALQDSLTGIWNDRKFEHEAKKILLQNKNERYGLFVIDIDSFKYINSVYGSVFGDSILKQMAHHLTQFNSNAIYARNYADRFVLLLPVSDNNFASEIAKKILSFKFYSKITTSQILAVKLKIGIFIVEPECERDILSVRNIIGKANFALKSIKNLHHNTYLFYDDKMENKAKLETIIEQNMENALTNGEFSVVFQPKYSLINNQVCGAEALVRWNSSVVGKLSPEIFIPLFEKNGFIQKLDFYVYEKVFSYMQKWKNDGKVIVPISVNMSRANIDMPNFLEKFMDLSQKYDIEPHNSEIEITESTFGTDNIKVRKFLNEFERKNFHVSIDDFGSGFSSLNLLRELPVHIIKLDKGFLDDAENSERATTIIAQIIKLAHKLSMKVVCEGVETKKQVELLTGIGCDIVQGFYFAKPMDPASFEVLLATKNSDIL